MNEAAVLQMSLASNLHTSGSSIKHKINYSVLIIFSWNRISTLCSLILWPAQTWKTCTISFLQSSKF